jgi:fumarylacetoacetate (FAA) hydrolase
MKLCSFSVLSSSEVVPGVLQDGRVHRIDAPSLIAVLESGLPAFGVAAEGHRLDGVRLHAPVPLPPSIRDFIAFEEHIATTRGRRGQEVPPFWYQEPVFYFSNPAAVIGPDDVVPYPAGTDMLDYELEVAAVIGAQQEIAGFTVMNDWSARDFQQGEVTVGLGPAKAKDFATSLGPVLVTVDEFDGTHAQMQARVNGELLSSGQLSDIFHPWESILERAARNTRLLPGDVLGSGTVGTGCLLELADRPYLQPGDVVELIVEGIGALRNTIGDRPAADPATQARAGSMRVRRSPV